MLEWENENNRVEFALELQECEKTLSKDGKDGKEAKDDISAAPDTGGWV